VLAIGYDSATIRLRSAGSLLCKGATRSPTAEQIVEAYEQLYAPPAEPSPALKASTGADKRADKRVAELEARPKSQSSKSRCIMSLQLRSASITDITDFTSQHHRHYSSLDDSTRSMLVCWHHAIKGQGGTDVAKKSCARSNSRYVWCDSKAADPTVPLSGLVSLEQAHGNASKSQGRFSISLWRARTHICGSPVTAQLKFSTAKSSM